MYMFDLIFYILLQTIPFLKKMSHFCLRGILLNYSHSVHYFNVFASDFLVSCAWMESDENTVRIQTTFT